MTTLVHVFLEALLLATLAAGAPGGPSRQAAPFDIFLPSLLNDAPRQEWAGAHVTARYGSPAWDVVVRGDVAYVGMESNLVAFRVLDDELDYIGQSPLLPGQAADVAIGQGPLDGIALVAVDDDTGRNGGLFLFDVREPGPPELISTVRVPTGRAEAVTVAGSMAFVSTSGWEGVSDGELLVLDLSSPARPTVLGRTAFGAAGPTRLDTNGAIVATSTGHVFDVTDPTAPEQVAELLADGVNGRDVAVDSRRIYLATDGSVEAFESESGLPPRHVGSTKLDPFVRPLLGIRLDGERLWAVGVTAGESRFGPNGMLFELDVSGDGDPIEVRRLRLPVPAISVSPTSSVSPNSSLAPTSGHLIVAGVDGALFTDGRRYLREDLWSELHATVSLVDPGTEPPTVSLRRSPPTGFSGATGSASVVYGRNRRGVWALAPEQPADRLFAVGRLEIVDWGEGIAADGTVVWVGLEEGLVAFRGPELDEQLSAVEPSRFWESDSLFATDAGALYAFGGYGNALTVFDVRNPLQPREVDHLASVDFAAAAGQHLATVRAYPEAQLELFTVADIEDISSVSTVPLGTRPWWPDIDVDWTLVPVGDRFGDENVQPELLRLRTDLASLPVLERVPLQSDYDPIIVRRVGDLAIVATTDTRLHFVRLEPFVNLGSIGPLGPAVESPETREELTWWWEEMREWPGVIPVEPAAGAADPGVQRLFVSFGHFGAASVEVTH